MKQKNGYRLLLMLSFITLSCANTAAQDNVVFQNEELKIMQISKNTYVHESYLQTETWGKVGCNGMIFVSKNEAAIFDTPTDSSSSTILLDWFKSQNIKPKAIIVNHFHNDCLGGLKVFHEAKIASYSSNLTKELAKKAGYEVPQNGFEKEQTLKIGNKKVINFYTGEAHTKDNIVSYVPSEKVLFGGCQVKEVGASKGFLGDANVASWPSTIENIKTKFPDCQHIVPGHGKSGGMELLDYTIKLFSEK